jgi:DUF4097 and DUF4098 domain-containing protein YvlB
MFKKPIIFIITLLLILTSFAIAQSEQDAERAQREAEKQVEREARRQAREEMQKKDKEKFAHKGEKMNIDDDMPGEMVQEVKVKVAGNARVNVSNFLGDVHVTGTDSDMLEATANDGNERIPLKYSAVGSTYTISYSPANSPHRGGDANIEVKLPRAAMLSLSVITGDAKISNVSGDIKANVVTGDLTIECAKGQVDARCVSGSIEILGATGSVQSESVSGDVIFKGELHPGGTYRLKSLSGEVEMQVQDNAPGFTATLTTFSGEIETDFPLKVEQNTQGSGHNQRLIGRYGDGQIKITLDSFSGAARIKKGGAVKSCR